jgi:hypothetical protein
MFRCVCTYIPIVDRYSNFKMCHCMYKLWIHISILRCATTCIHIYLCCRYKLYIKMYRYMCTYILIVDRYVNPKICSCMYINQTEPGNMHTRTEVQQIYHQYWSSHLPLILSKTMRTECAALCIVLVIMYSTLSSCFPCKYITSFVLTIIPLIRGL